MSGTGTPERVRKGAAKADALILALGENIDEAIKRERQRRRAAASESQTSGSASEARSERDERIRVKIASYGGRKLNSREKGELCDDFEVKSWDTIRRALKK